MKLIALACHHMVLVSQWLTQMSYEKCLEFENNAISCMTFAGWPTCRLGIPYMYD